MNYRLFCFWLVSFAALTTMAGAEEKEFHLKLSLDPLLDLSKTWLLTADEIDQQFSSPNFRENPYLQWAAGKQVARFSRQPFSNISVDLSLMTEALPVETAEVALSRDDLKASQVGFNFSQLGPEQVNALRSRVNAMLGVESRPGPARALGWKSDVDSKSETWSGTAGVGLVESVGKSVRVTLARPGKNPTLLSGAFKTRQSGEDRALAFFVRVDQALPVPTLWGMTAEQVEHVLELPDSGMKESPFFKWNTTGKDSARLAHKLFSNTQTDLLLFNDSVQAEEVNLEFKEGRAAKLVCTLLTRGNSGDNISAAQFDTLFKATGRALGGTLGVRPTRTTVAGKSLSKTEGWLWTTPHTLALLEFNVEAPKGKVEFLRLTLTPAKARAELLNLAGLGDNATTRNRGSLASSVKRDPATGDVEIAGVPMRDQGQKGYCVAASCERLFRYLGVPCDMDELAQLVSADAERGASPSVMYSSLTKIDQRYNMRVKLLKIPPRYGLGEALKSKSELERAQKADLAKLIHENIDQGLPLLWCVELAAGETGISPNGAPSASLDRNGPRVGHMRLIIGYNSTSNGVIYTDSWGAGHERKVMSRNEAMEMTTAVFSMAPSR